MSQRIRNSHPEALTRARELRKEMSDSERRLWARLRGKSMGCRVRRQYSVGPYIADFFVYEAKLCIEVDSEVHDERLERDARRDAYFLSRGIETLRIPSMELWTRLDGWVEIIWRLIQERRQAAPPP